MDEVTVKYGIETLNTLRLQTDGEWQPYGMLFNTEDDALARVEDSLTYWKQRGIDYYRIRIFSVIRIKSVIREVDVV